MVSKLGTYTVFGLATLFGPGSVVAFFVFLFAGSPNLIRLELSEVGLLSLDAFLCAAFFLQHSCMVRRSFRRWVGKCLPGYYDGAFFAIASGIVLLALLFLWQESMNTVVTFQNIGRWFFHGLYFLGLGGVGWCLWALGSLDPFGIQPLFDHLRGKASPKAFFIIRGPYRWVRHPIYLLQIMIIWSSPDLSSDRLLLNCMWSTWIVIATVLEERDLRAEFGEAYSDYQRRVPMLFPLRLRMF